MRGTLNRKIKTVIWSVLAALLLGASVFPQAVFAGGNKVILDVPFIDQSDYPTGCEAASMTMMLDFYGADVTIDEVVKTMPKEEVIYENEDTVSGPHPDEVFAGFPTEESGFGCYAGVAVLVMNELLPEDKIAVEVTDISLSDLCAEYIDKGNPVLVWATIDMKESYTTRVWETLKGTYTWIAGEHCLVLTGYDDDFYYFNDPLKNKDVSYAKATAKKRYEELGLSAVIVKDRVNTNVKSPAITSIENYRDGIRITWDAQRKAKSYNIYRKDSDEFKLIGETSETSFVDDLLLESGTVYEYKVRANDKEGESDEDTYTRSIIYLSSPKLESAEVSSSGVALSWKEVAGAKTYYIYRKLKGGSWSKIAAAQGNSFVDSSDLTSGKTYVYTIRAAREPVISWFDASGISVEY